MDRGRWPQLAPNGVNGLPELCVSLDQLQRDAPTSEHLLNHLHVGAAGDGQAGGRVPQLVRVEERHHPGPSPRRLPAADGNLRGSDTDGASGQRIKNGVSMAYTNSTVSCSLALILTRGQRVAGGIVLPLQLSGRVRILTRCQTRGGDKNWWISDTTTDPSPTAEATRLTDPRRTSPIANTPGTVVS